MIGRLSGILVEKHSHLIVVDVGGVGYELQVPLSTSAALEDPPRSVTVLVRCLLREEQLLLYGFRTPAERQMFDLLIGTSGVGPALALRVLSGLPVEELLAAIRAGRVDRLMSIPGVGKKTAERIVVELRDRLSALEPAAAPAAPASATGPAEDVVSALINLGYDRREAEAAVRSVAGGAGDFETLFRAALAALSARKASRAEK
jgi:Holliday junction DNA helicase RuvA